MIQIQFQALSNYEKRETDEKEITDLFEDLQATYATLFQDEEVVIDVTVDQNPHTLHKKITVSGYIPKHGKIFAEAEATTFSQAVSKLKSDLQRYSREKTQQLTN